MASLQVGAVLAERRNVILADAGRRFLRDAKASRRNRQGEPGASALGSPERPSLPTRLPFPQDHFVPRSVPQAKRSGDLGGHED